MIKEYHQAPKIQSDLLAKSKMMVSSEYVTVRDPSTGVIKLKIMLKNNIDLMLLKNSVPKI